MEVVPGVRLLVGDCRARLGGLPPRSVHLCVTSPPYYGLRDYQTAEWEGGDPDCEHRFGGQVPQTKNRGTPKEKTITGGVRPGADCFVCKKCGARRVDLQIGLEKRHDCDGAFTGAPCGACYVCHLVEVFRLVRRVLRDDGIFVLNLGDSYISQGGTGQARHWDGRAKNTETQSFRRKPTGDLGAKQLLMVPERVALALQADGWVLRSKLPWVKRSGMPEAVTDRPSSALECVLMFSKGEDYYWDRMAVRPKAAPSTAPRLAQAVDDQVGSLRANGGAKTNGNMKAAGDGDSRNMRNSDLWFESLKPPHGLVGLDDELVGLDVTAKGITDAHFASYPADLVRPFVKAGTSQRGACPQCGTCWERVTEKDRRATRPGLASKVYVEPPVHPESPVRRHNSDVCGNRDPGRHCTTSGTLGWRPNCTCYGVPLIGDPPRLPHQRPQEADAAFVIRLADYEAAATGWRALWAKLAPRYAPLAAVPCVVLDPFLGAGTTALVAVQHGRHAVGVELSEAYVEIVKRRLRRGGRTGRPPRRTAAGFNFRKRSDTHVSDERP